MVTQTGLLQHILDRSAVKIKGQKWLLLCTSEAVWAPLCEEMKMEIDSAVSHPMRLGVPYKLKFQLIGDPSILVCELQLYLFHCNLMADL